jgi:hypothetical protein
METKSRNLEWTGIISVVKKQFYQRLFPSEHACALNELSTIQNSEQTTVCTTVTLRSRLGRGKFTNRGDNADAKEEKPVNNFVFSLSTAGIQEIITKTGVQRTQDAISRNKRGMNVVLERLCIGEIVYTLAGLRHDQEAAFRPESG